MKNIEILFENDDCIILSKPAGLPVQGGERVGASLDTILAAERNPSPLLVHRLDKDTSGIMVVAKHRKAAAALSELIAGRQVRKLYCAVCCGSLKDDAGIINESLDVQGQIKESRTRYSVLSRQADITLVELELDTGRMHQIRRHLSLIGYPILGDDKYGNFLLNKQLKKERGLNHLLLHSRAMIFPEELGIPDNLQAPFPAYFSQFL